MKKYLNKYAKSFFIISILTSLSIIGPINFAKNVETTDTFYPTLDIKFGKLPKNEIISELVQRESFENITPFIQSQLDNITWHDSGGVNDQIIIIKMIVTNWEGYELRDVKVKLWLPPNLEGDYLTYISDCSWIVPHRTADFYGNSVFDWVIPSIPAKSNSFLKPDEDRDGIVFMLKSIYPSYSNGYSISGKILSANGNDYTDWDYQVAPQMLDYLTFSSASGYTNNKLHIEKIFESDPIAGSKKYSYFGLGKKIDFTLKVKYHEPAKTYIINGNVTPAGVSSDLEIIEYVPSFLEVDVKNLSKNIGSDINVTYSNETHKIRWYKNFRRYIFGNIHFEMKYSATIKENATFSFIPSIVKFAFETDLDWIGMDCKWFRPSLFLPRTSYNFGTLSFDETDTAFFQIWNDGDGAISYVINESVDWMEVYPNFGTLNDEHDIIHVKVNTTDLTEAEYEGNINIWSNVGSKLIKIFFKLKSGLYQPYYIFYDNLVLLRSRLTDRFPIMDFLSKTFNLLIEKNIGLGCR